MSRLEGWAWGVPAAEVRGRVLLARQGLAAAQAPLEAAARFPRRSWPRQMLTHVLTQERRALDQAALIRALEARVYELEKHLKRGAPDHASIPARLGPAVGPPGGNGRR